MYNKLLSYAALIIFGIKSSQGDVLVYTTPSNQLIEEFQSLAAHFGPSFPQNGLRVFAVPGNPPDGCSTMDEAPKANFSIRGVTPRFAAVIVRGDCTFAEKVRHAQNASFDAVIVYNKDSDALEIMSASDDSDIFIPSLFVGSTSGNIINFDYTYKRGFFLILNDDFPFNINTHLIIPFCVVVGMCFIIMLGFMIARCVRERRRIMRYRLPTSSLKKLESRKYTKNEIYDTCAICLDDYEEGDRLRILPCRHAYHTKCIDVWLTKNRRVCPVCKRKVYAIGERRRQQRRRRSADSTTDSMSSFDPDDTTPLINSQNISNNVNHGTFNGETDDAPLDATSGAQDVSDDEVLDSQQQPVANQRFNPFNRVPNLPPQLADELAVTVDQPDENVSIWGRFKRIFTFNRQTDDDDAPLLDNNQLTTSDDVDIIIRPEASRSRSIPSGNNILNLNHSGSFREENEIPTNAVRAHKSAPNILQRNENEPGTSSSAPRRLGLAAIPNNNIQFLSSSSTRNDSNGRE